MVFFLYLYTFWPPGRGAALGGRWDMRGPGRLPQEDKTWGKKKKRKRGEEGKRAGCFPRSPSWREPSSGPRRRCHRPRQRRRLRLEGRAPRGYWWCTEWALSWWQPRSHRGRRRWCHLVDPRGSQDWGGVRQERPVTGPFPHISPSPPLDAKIPTDKTLHAPMKAAAAGSTPTPSRCSWTLPTPEVGARHSDAARRGKSTAWADFEDLRRSLSHLQFSPSLSPEMRKKSMWRRAWACSLLSLGLSFVDGLWRLGLRLLGLDLNLEPRPKPMLKMGLLSWAHFYYCYYYYYY